MNHNIVTDDDGNEHQAVDGAGCLRCSLKIIDCLNLKADCTPRERTDNSFAIYKRKIKLSDIIIKS